MIQTAFADNASQIVATDSSLIGLAVGGSWLNNELDKYSDLDLVLVTSEKISDDKLKMLEYARRFGNLLTGFTGEHVGEHRLLICLYADPLLHVDIKFVTLEEFRNRVEDPVLLVDKQGLLKAVIRDHPFHFPMPDFQWIEDRFWIWIHYALLKVARGEYMEAFDFLGYLRTTVFGPLLHIKNGGLPRGVRKVEFTLNTVDLRNLQKTLADYDRDSIITAVQNGIELYRALRAKLFDQKKVTFQRKTEDEVILFFKSINKDLIID